MLHRPLHCGGKPGAISALRAQMVHQLDEEMKTAPLHSCGWRLYAPGSQRRSLSTYRLYLLDKGWRHYVLAQSRTANSSASRRCRAGPKKVRKQNEEAVTVNSVGSSSDWRVLAVPIVANDTSGLSEEASLIIAMPLKQTNQVVALVGVLTFAFWFGDARLRNCDDLVIVTHTFDRWLAWETAAKIAAGDLSRRIEDFSPGSW